MKRQILMFTNMASDSSVNKIWVHIKRFDVTEPEPKPSGNLLCINVSPEADSEQVKSQLKKELQVDHDAVFKLRNSRQSLLPINGQLPPNARLTPYTLEVVRPHQFVHPNANRAQSAMYEECMRQAFKRLQERVDQLESHWPNIHTKRTSKICQDIKELEQRLDFMSKRFTEGDDLKWEGMFKRHPLW